MSSTPLTNGYRPHIPFHMVWLATNMCNARCLHCSSNSMVRTSDELRENEVCDLLTQFAEAGVVDIAISGGEPLLRHDLFRIILHARTCGLSVGVGSNGGKLSEHQAAALADAGINRFQVSLDGLRQSHEELRRWPGLFDRVLRTLEIAQTAGLRTHICCTINRMNAGELEAFAQFVSTTGVKRINLSRYVPTGRGTDSLDLAEDEWHSIIHLCVKLRDLYRGKLEIVTHLAQQILVDDDIANMPGFVGCQPGIGQGCVTANGTVFPCVLLPIPVGNIREAPFQQLWRNSPIIQTLQARERLKGACGNCALKERCGGCRAVAFAKTGDYLATDPRCWLPRIRGSAVN